MPFLGLKKAAPVAAERPAPADAAEVTILRGEISALRRSQAVIEFSLDGTILNANENFLAVTGYTLDEIRGQHHRMFVDPVEAATPAYREFWNRLGRGEFDAGEYRRFGKGGREVWIQASYNPVLDADGRPVRVVKYASDLTPFKHEQQNSKRLLSMIENMPIAVMYVDRELVIRYANSATADMLKRVEHMLPVPADKLVGVCIDRFHKNPEHQRRLLADPSNLPITTQIKIGDESLSFSVNAIYDDRGEYIGAMASGRIITEELRMKEKASMVGSTVASSVTEMVATIEEIAKNVSRTANLAREAEGVANQTGADVATLGDSSRKIGEVVGVIQELADQTNLLALNATIEAARAGESGRSFAVVASEVKELASATAKATENIEQSVRQIQESINKVVDSTQRITTGIAEVSTNTSTVAAAIEEQSATMAGLGETASELQALTSV